jgi:hypothetical protein
MMVETAADAAAAEAANSTAHGAGNDGTEERIGA